jgi:sulfatase maturation enzyme AslB (radical SAM superfamily)
MKGIYISGSADPFASKSYRKILTNFDRKKYPNLNTVHLHTNAILFDEEMWEQMKKIQSMVCIVEISIDAATKDTYELIRRGGHWETLIKNLKFISTLPIAEIRVSMVVQDDNFMEMSLFYDLMSDIFKNKAKIFYKKIGNWGTYTNEEFFNKEVFNEDHPLFNLFLIELAKVDKRHNCVHNFHDIAAKHLKKEKTFI